MMHQFVLLILLILTTSTGEEVFEISATLTDTTTKTTTTLKKHLDCRPRPVVKEVGDLHERLKPRNLVLHQCSGYSGDVGLRNHKCVSTEKRTVSYKVYNFDRNIVETRSHDNHTACAMRCVCMRKMDYWQTNDPSTVEVTWCPPETNWNISTCKCDPVIISEKEPGIQSSHGRGCDSGGSVGVNVLVCAMVGQLLLFVVVQFIIQWYNHRVETSGTPDVDKETDV